MEGVLTVLISRTPVAWVRNQVVVVVDYQIRREILQRRCKSLACGVLLLLCLRERRAACFPSGDGSLDDCVEVWIRSERYRVCNSFDLIQLVFETLLEANFSSKKSLLL